MYLLQSFHLQNFIQKSIFQDLKNKKTNLSSRGTELLFTLSLIYCKSDVEMALNTISCL